jgi:hypothetical protein
VSDGAEPDPLLAYRTFDLDSGGGPGEEGGFRSPGARDRSRPRTSRCSTTRFILAVLKPGGISLHVRGRDTTPRALGEVISGGKPRIPSVATRA